MIDDFDDDEFCVNAENRRFRSRHRYAAGVQIDEVITLGRDISRRGMAVTMTDPPDIGAIVRVVLSPGDRDKSLDEISGRARVVRVDPSRKGFRVALEFTESASAAIEP